MLINYKENEMHVKCLKCEGVTIHRIDPQFNLEYDAEFGVFTPYSVECSTDGCDTTIFINPHIPEGEFEEYEMELIGDIPLEEINARKFTRDFLWNHRRDLKEMDRAMYNKGAEKIVEIVDNKYLREMKNHKHMRLPIEKREI